MLGSKVLHDILLHFTDKAHITRSSFTFINGYELGNVASIFEPFLHDMGYFGVIFYTVLMAVISQIAYQEAIRPKAKNKIYISVIVYSHKTELDASAEKVVYTGPIDAYFGFCFGPLEYRSVRFETEVLDKPNFQGNAAVNYTDRETPWTRIIEHKWFQFGRDDEGNELPKTVISREYSSEWKPGDEPYYPVNDEKNSALYAQYKALAEGERKVLFGGRLAEYKYYDMDQVLKAALEAWKKEWKKKTRLGVVKENDS